MDYVAKSIRSINKLRSDQLLGFELQSWNNSQCLNLLDQLWGTEIVLRLLVSPTLDMHRPLLRQVDSVVGKAITLVNGARLKVDVIQECYLEEQYLEVFLDLRWWTWMMIYKVDHKSIMDPRCGERYFVTPKGLLSLSSSRLPSFMRTLYFWWSGSNVRHLPSYAIEVSLQENEGLSNQPAWLKTERGKKLEIFDSTKVILPSLAKAFIVEGKGLVSVRHASKPSWVRDELKIDLTQVVLGVSHSGLVIKCADSRKEFALKRVNKLDEKQPVIARLFQSHIVQLVDYWQENGFLFVMMELMEGDLEELIASRFKLKKLPFVMNVAVDIILQIAKAILYLHDMELTYPHLKSSDVLYREAKDISELDKNETYYLVKLGDFRFYSTADFESRARRNVHHFGLICLEVLSEAPLQWDFEERNPEVPAWRFVEIQNGYGSAFPELLTLCIKRCLDGSIKFSEIVVMLFMTQVQVLTRDTKEDLIGCSDDVHKLLAKQQDVPLIPASSSRSTIISKAGLSEDLVFQTHSNPDLALSQDLEDMKLIPVEDDLGASRVPVYLSVTDLGDGEYISISAALDLCGNQVQEFVNLLPSVNIFRFLSTYLVETLSSAAMINFMRYLNILSLFRYQDLQGRRFWKLLRPFPSEKKIRSSFVFCFESLVGLARHFQLVVALLRKCSSSDWYKSALELTDLFPSKHLRRCSEFSLLIQNCKFNLDVVELAFQTLENTMGADTAKGFRFKWSEKEGRMVLQTRHHLEVKNVFPEDFALEICSDLEVKDLTALKVKLQRLIESERAEMESFKGVFNTVKLANYLIEKLTDSSETYRATINPSSLEYCWCPDQDTVVIADWLGMKVAVKIFTKAGNPMKIMSNNKISSKNEIISGTWFENNLNISAVAQHPNIVRFIGWGFIEESNTGLLVMELMDHDLRTIINNRLRVLPEGSSPFPLFVAIDLMFQIAQAMSFLRDHKIMHLDLKTQNVLVKICKPLRTSSREMSNSANTILMELPIPALVQETYIAKLCDFGSAKHLPDSAYINEPMVGTTGWRAPELHRHWDTEVAGAGTWPADVYSYAMTCYEILTGRKPFQGLPLHSLHREVMAGVRPSFTDLYIPQDVKQLVEDCWATDPMKRPSFKYIVRNLWSIRCKLCCPGLRPGQRWS